jgi:hypothetical protein
MMSQIEKSIDEKMVQMGLADHLSRLGWEWAEAIQPTPELSGNKHDPAA